jgi:peptide/nickel transport system substrate-binding protein
MRFRHSFTLLSGLILGLLLLAACGQALPAPHPTSTPGPTLTATRVPSRQLTICLGQEPASLYPLDNSSAAAHSVLSAIYDGPIDTNSYGYQAVLLERLPDLENGDAQLFSEPVEIGDEVVDASGTPVTLAVGVKIRPAGCQSDSCAIKYDGTTNVMMDQMQATFRILPGLSWSDGDPLTAGDSVYAYQVAAFTASSSTRFLVDRTKSYEAVDDSTVQWWGKPGFVDSTYFTNFWSPLPKHVWDQFDVDQLSKTDQASRTPLGWGAYVIEEWVAGDHITLNKNLQYFRAEEGLPKFDTLIFRFVPDPGDAISDLVAGSCDILDPTVRLDGQVNVLRSMAEQKQLQAWFTTLPVMEELAFGIRPASYDNGINPETDRVDFFGDVRVRQALALCLDRQQVVASVLGGLSAVPDSYLPPEDPLYISRLTTYAFDVTAGAQLLELAGWKDVDNDPSTARQAWGVPGVPSGTPFEVTYITTNAVQRQQAATILAASLAQCGIKVDVQYLDADTLYAPGPEGVLFGRNFDLAEFAMGTTGIESSCAWYTSSEIPEAANKWVGTNVSGFSDSNFDATCLASEQTIPDDPNHAAAYAQSQTIFANKLPVIPLYWRVKTAAARADLCNFSLDPSASSSLWNIETFDRGAGCTP